MRKGHSNGFNPRYITNRRYLTKIRSEGRQMTDDNFFERQHNHITFYTKLRIAVTKRDSRSYQTPFPTIGRSDLFTIVMVMNAQVSLA